MPIDVNCSAWKGFRTGEWRHLVNVRNFIQKNYTPYAGDESFLAPTSARTQKVWDKSHELILEELRKGILDVETDAISGINNFAPGYIDRGGSFEITVFQQKNFSSQTGEVFCYAKA